MLGSLISAGANLVGGLFGRSSAKKANEQNIAQQREFAQSGVQWRVEDARKAGVSPLVALGMSPVSFSPSSVGDTSMSSAFSAMGQDIGRAVNATAGPQARMDKQVQALTLTKMGLENELLASQIRRLNQVGPPMPDGSTRHVIPGQGDAPILEVRPATRMPATVGPTGRVGMTGPGMDAEAAEQRYGDIVQEVYGIANWIADNFPNATRVLNAPASYWGYGSRRDRGAPGRGGSFHGAP